MKNNIRKIYIYRILLSMLFPVPTIVLFWQRHGMTLTDVMVLQALFALAMVILEVPSGYLADVIGRRKTLIYAGLSCLIAVIIYSQGKCFFDFFWAEMAFAIGFAFISGADAAMIYDTLQATGEEHTYQEIYGKMNFYSLLAIGVSNILGGIIGSINYRWTFYATIPFAFFHQFARGFTRIVVTDYINRLTESDTRATVLSTQNLIMRLFYAMLIPVAGKIADLTSIIDALRILGFTTLLIGIIMLLIMRKAKVV